MTHTGASRSKNVGTSNHNRSEKLRRRKIKVSLAMIVIQGLAGPKGMVRTVPDGHMVNIPWLLRIVMRCRSVVCKADYWISVHALSEVLRKIRELPLMALAR